MIFPKKKFSALKRVRQNFIEKFLQILYSNNLSTNKIFSSIYLFTYSSVNCFLFLFFSLFFLFYFFYPNLSEISNGQLSTFHICNSRNKAKHAQLVQSLNRDLKNCTEKLSDETVSSLTNLHCQKFCQQAEKAKSFVVQQATKNLALGVFNFFCLYLLSASMDFSLLCIKIKLIVS